MSDPPPAPAKKVGSLRDRIAQFEQQSQSSAPAGPAPGAPAPGRFKAREWKPRPKTPPSPASNANANVSANAGAGFEDAGSGVTSGEGSVIGDDEKPRGGSGGMSASDAKETIGRAGGSLKERMAALRGQGGFGPAGGELLFSVVYLFLYVFSYVFVFLYVLMFSRSLIPFVVNCSLAAAICL
jgi:myosin tail region-interacting protein MTI1